MQKMITFDVVFAGKVVVLDLQNFLVNMLKHTEKVQGSQ